MKIGVFCSANNNIDPDFFTATEEMGRWMADNGHTLVFGGCNIGLMQCIGKAVKDHGGMTIGVVPTLVERGGKKFADLDVEIACDNLSDRKELVAAHTIGYHNKRVIVYDLKGFWGKLIELLDDMQERGFVRGSWHDYIDVAHSLDDIAKLCAG